MPPPVFGTPQSERSLRGCELHYQHVARAAAVTVAVVNRSVIMTVRGIWVRCPRRK
jgi:hypothetical protein